MTEIKIESEDLLACRICLATDTKLFGIYECRLEDTFADVMDTTISAWDGLPQHLCLYCQALLLKSAGLRERCHRGQKLLRQLQEHQQYLTTEFIHAIDRVSNQLSLHLTIDNLDQPIELTHNESSKKDYILIDIIEDPIIDNNTFDDADIDNAPPMEEFNDAGSISDDDLPLKRIERNAIPEINVEPPKKASRQQKVVKEVKSVKTTRNVKNIPKIVVENVDESKQKEKKVRKKAEKPLKVKKKGFNRFFQCDEDYVKFENNYNVTIEKVSEEEQVKDMEARKQSSNYLRAHMRCDKCFKGFLSEATFENHQKVHDPMMGSNECHLCYARFKHPTRLRRHMESHTLKFICKLCPLVTRHRAMAMMHADFHSGKTFDCKYCGLNFKKKTTFNTHIRIQHPLENASGGTCDVCGETFIGKRGLQQHKTMAHRKKTTFNTHIRIQHPLENASGGTCDVCGETFIGKLGLQQHKTMAHRKLPIKELKCTVCNVQFENLDAVVRHASATCDPALRACPQCGETFETEDDLLSHSESAHVKQLFNCEDCDKSFATISSLGTHVDRVHLKIKPKKTAFYKYHRYPAKTHKRVEEICEVCGKGYPSSTWLKYHQRTHTGERPYKCPSCPKSYMTPAALQSHSVSHTGVRRWQCSVCSKTFLHQSSVYKHKLVHTGEKPFTCHICSKTFTQSGSLATHVKYVHMKLKPPPRRRRHHPA